MVDTKQSFNTVTNKMDLELCDLIFLLNETKQMEQLESIMTDHYKLQNYFVKDPKPVNERKRIEIEETSNNEKKESKSKFSTIYFYIKEHKIMVQGSDINLRMFTETYFYVFKQLIQENECMLSYRIQNERETIL